MKNQVIKTEYQLPVPLPVQPEEREVLMPRKRLTVADWALQKRKLSRKTTNLAGDWSHEYTPYAVEIMNALSDVITREVWVRKCAQAAGTEIGLNFLGRSVEEAPAPMLIVMPREDDANRRVATRIKPMFESTPSLLKHIKGRVDNINVGKETILDNMIMYLAWAGSPAATADNPICYGVLDEVGKFPKAAGREADPVNLIRDRITTFYLRSKIYGPSTPVLTGDLVDREYNAGDQRKDWVKCPYCNQRHIQLWKYVELDKDSVRKLLSPEDYSSGQCARYVCPECGTRWTEQDRWSAVSEGRWAPRDCKVTPDGRITGKVFSNPHKSYQIHSLMLYPGFMNIARLAKEWSAAQIARKAGDIGPLQNFINSRLGEPFEEREKETDEGKLALHIGTYKPAIVPKGCQMLVLGADVQIDHIWWRLNGYGYLSEVWSIDEGRLETGDTKELENWHLFMQLLSSQWPMEEDSNRKMSITIAAVDCGYLPDVVRDFIQQASEVNIIAVRGDPSVKARLFRAVKMTGSTVIRYDLNVNAIKDRLHRLMYQSTVPGPGYFHLHSETSGEVLDHLAAEEQKVYRKGKKTVTTWVIKEGHKANHLFDCDVYADFAAELAGARTLPDPDTIQPPEQRRVGRIQQR